MAGRGWMGLVAALFVVDGAQAGAATIDVPCDPAALVTAVNTANGQPGADTIDLAPGCLYEFTTNADNWFGPNALPAIASTITINGRGAVIDRSSAGGTPPFRLFFVGADPANPNTDGYTSPGPGDLTLVDVGVFNGLAHGGNGDFGGGGGAGMGGAIFNMGRLTLVRSTLSNNSATGGDGASGNGGAGGGIASNASGVTAGGFGGSVPGAGVGAAGGGQLGMGGGGGGFRGTEAGQNWPPGDGGGAETGTGGRAGASPVHASGDGAGGGGSAGTGGSFGRGGRQGGGGGVGGGGSGSSFVPGGGGFGGGGGPGTDQTIGATTATAAGGGFGGGGGGAFSTTGSCVGGAAGFGASAGSKGSDGGGGGGGAGLGGAIFNVQGAVSVVNSTLVSNSTHGGADAGVCGTATLGLGGAIFNLNGEVTAESSTFSAGTTDGGGGIYSLGYDGASARHAIVTLHRTIVTGTPAGGDVVSDAPANVKPDLANVSTSTIDVSDHNVIPSAVTTAGGTITGSALTANPKLGVLGRYRSGLTPTVPPGTGSVVHDAGGSGCPPSDQNGQPRVGACDIGAFEVTAPANDDLVAARVLSGSSLVFSGDDIGATKAVGEPNPPGGVASASVWYSWHAASDGELIVGTCFEGTTLPSVLVGVWTGSTYGTLVAVASHAASSSSSCAHQASLGFFVTAGTTYRISVDGPSSFQGAFRMSLDGPGDAPDTTSPVITFDAGPSGPTTDSQPIFSFHADEPSTFVCSLDEGTPDFVPCSQTFYADVLAEGAWTFRVKATDEAGNSATATRSFTVDTTGPTVTIDSGPSGLTNQPTAVFAFSSAAADLQSFECRFDAGTFAACQSGQSYPGLADGSQHAFAVRALDQLGNVGPESTRTFTVDTSPPTITIDSGPSGRSTQTVATFTFSSPAADLAGFTCALDDQPPAACSSGQSYNTIADGAHTFHVRASDAAGNQSSDATQTFTLDTTGPTVTIDSGPSGPMTDTTAVFAFSSAAIDLAGFECKLDTGTFTACASGQPYANLAEGSHTFAVRAHDTLGNVGPSEQRTFTVTADSPPDTIMMKRPKARLRTRAKHVSVLFTFRSPTVGVTFTCTLDKAKPMPCTSPARYRVKRGRHTFTVAAVGSSGTDPTPATVHFRVVTVR